MTLGDEVKAFQYTRSIGVPQCYAQFPPGKKVFAFTFNRDVNHERRVPARSSRILRGDTLGRWENDYLPAIYAVFREQCDVMRRGRKQSSLIIRLVIPFLRPAFEFIIFIVIDHRHNVRSTSTQRLFYLI
jgi:hypothetical protein